jgi:diguanylate cyclase (GGDEF)-like protein
MSLAIIRQGLSFHDEAWLFCIFMMTMLTAYTALQLAGQIAVERGVERRVWLLSASAIAGFGRVAVQLALVRLLEGAGNVRFDVKMILLAYAAAFGGRYLALRSVSDDFVRLPILLSVGVFEGLTIFVAQWALFRAARLNFGFSRSNIATMLLLCVITCIFGLISVAGLIHQEFRDRKKHAAHFIYVLMAGFYLLLIPFVMREVVRLHPAHRESSAGRYIGPVLHHTSLVILIGFAPVLLVSAQIAVFLQLRGQRWGRDLLAKEHQQRIYSTLVEQKVTRLQNEALVKEIRERKKIEAELIQTAFHDSVTGLHNRAYVANHLRTKLGRGRSGGSSALLYINIDNFKSVNDMLGHSQGDQYLIAMASRLRNCVRVGDVLSCMGGDKFVVLPNRMLTQEHGMRLAQHVLNAMEQPMEVAGTTFNLTASIGLCLLDVSYSSPEAVLRDADMAMYAAKRKGGSQIVVYQPAMLTEAIAALNAKSELTAAIANNEFTLFYQPLVHIRDGSIYGVEALIRWNHPDKGLVAPGLFIPLAEQTGHIVEIGTWGMRQACKEYKQLKSAFSKDLLLSVNISTRQLEQASFLEQLKLALHETGMPPRCLQLEITESILLSDPERTGMLFKTIRSLGVKIAFDDFGTGYSSLSYIQRYPIDTLKIDQSFVRALNNGPVDLEIVAIMMKLAEITNMSVSAEGIETEAEAEKLLSIGCTVAQGYLYSRPMPLSASLKYLSNNANLIERTNGVQPLVAQGYKRDVVQ